MRKLIVFCLTAVSLMGFILKSSGGNLCFDSVCKNGARYTISNLSNSSSLVYKKKGWKIDSYIISIWRGNENMSFQCKEGIVSKGLKRIIRQKPGKSRDNYMTFREIMVSKGKKVKTLKEEFRLDRKY